MLLIMLLSAVQMAASAVVPPADPTAPAVSATSSKCPATMHQADGDLRPAARRLDQLPPGRLELTVLRQMGTCPEPVVLREGIGGNTDSPDGTAPGRR